MLFNLSVMGKQGSGEETGFSLSVKKVALTALVKDRVWAGRIRAGCGTRVQESGVRIWTLGKSRQNLNRF